MTASSCQAAVGSSGGRQLERDMQARGREAVRVRVQKFEANIPLEIRKFSVDPQITSLDELRSILVTAFDLKEDFTLCYKYIDDYGQEEYLALFSDWDLDAAFLRAQNMSASGRCEPCIYLKVDLKHSNVENSCISNMSKSETTPKTSYIQKSPTSSDPITTPNSDLKQIQMGFQGMLMNHMEKTLNLVSRALNLSEDPDAPPRPPLNQAEFLSFLSPVGHVQQGSKLREVIYSGGIDPGCRKVIWKHILNVYPDGLSGKERLDYMKRKSAEYYSLRDVWRDCLHKEQLSSDLTYVTNMVRKDVLRTDRHHKFFSGSDDNQNITALFNILTTYALNHPIVSYCQGMSDLASPLLVVMANEAHAYICLCALMKRLYPNFLLDGEAMTLKFSHLSECLQVYDPVFYTYLQSQQADDLLFCYRWLLLEMKREFAFDDALHMLEVLWSSLPSTPPTEELSLKDKEFSPDILPGDISDTPNSPISKPPRENVYTKLCAIRRQSSSYNLTSSPKSKMIYQRMNLSFDENIGKENCIPQHQISKEFQSLDESYISEEYNRIQSPTDESVEIFNTDESKEDNSVKNSTDYAAFNGNSKNIKLGYSKIQNSEFLKTSVNNKSLPNLDKNNSDESSEHSRKLVKNLSEFNNLSVSKKTIQSDISNDIEKNGLEIVTNNDHLNNKILNSQDEVSKNNDIDSKLSSISDVPECNIPTTNKNTTEQFNFHFSDGVFIWENPLHDTDVKKKLFSDREFIKTNKLNCDSQNVSVSEVSKNINETENLKQNILGNKDIKMMLPIKPNAKFFSNMSQELENAKKNCEVLLSNKRCANLQNIASTITNFQKKYDHQNHHSSNIFDNVNNAIHSCEEVNEANATKPLSVLLPPSKIFGGGNPFLIFLCLTLLIQHRDYIMRSRMDYNELAMYFDKMVRKHNVHRVLNQARRMYTAYLKEQSENAAL